MFAGPALPALGHALAGSTGSAISNIFTYPLALIITRLQIQRQLRKTSSSPRSAEYESIRDAALKIYGQEGGLTAFYVGVVQDTVKTIADSFLFFLAYNFLRQSRLQSRKDSAKRLPVMDELSIGFIAGALAKLITTPMANIVTRKQSLSMITGRSPDLKSYDTSTRSIALQIKSEKGLRGFWSGYSASLVLTLNPSLTFFLFESFKRILLSRNQRSNPSPRVTFLLAATSKAIASTITYPFSLAKARAQVSSKEVDECSDDEHESKSIKGSEQRSRIRSSRIPTNVFSTLLDIVRHEGIGALYEGLGGEVLKGFFSHGITMIVKESVHKFIIQLYYALLKLLKSYPSPQELAEPAKERISRIATKMEEQTTHALAASKEAARAAVAEWMEVSGSKNLSRITAGFEQWEVKMKPTLQNLDESKIFY